VIALFGVMAVDAALELRRELNHFEADMALDEEAMGRAVRVAVETVAQKGGPDAARATLDRIRASEDRVDLRWVWLDSAGAGLTAADRDRLLAGESVRVVRSEPSGDRHLTLVPLRVPGDRAAALQLSEPLGPQRAFLRRTELQVLGTLLALVLVCGTIALWLGVIFIGRPLDALAAQARRVADGDFSRRLGLTQNDEVGVLAREFDRMCDGLVEAQRRVQAEIDARIAALEQLRHADRLKTVGQLASGVAHELGTPLNVVGGRAKLIASGAFDGEDVTASARIIAEQADRMAAIIRQLLDFARQRHLRGTTIELRDVVDRTVEMLTVMARTRRVSIALDVAPGPIRLRADPGQLQQAIANVLVNAIQAMPQGGQVRVRVGPATTPSRRPFWSIVVEDEGGGIAPEHLLHIFDPFFTTKDVGEGTGLGLAVAHGIATEHGGRIDVSSTPGRGSRFEILLAADTTDATANTHDPATPVAGNSREAV